jgi:hypothetical protein
MGSRLYYPPVEEDWPPPDARARAALWEAERWLRTGAYAAAGDALEGASSAGTPESAEVARGLRLLAAAGYRHLSGDSERAGRLLARARDRLAPHLPVYEDVDLGALVDLVEDAIRS